MPPTARQAIPVLRDAAILATPTQDLLARLDAVLGTRRQLAAIATTIPGSHTSYEALLYIPGSDDMLHAVSKWAAKWRLRTEDETFDGERRLRVYDDFGEVLAVVWPANDTIVVDPIEAGWTWSPVEARK